VTDEALASLCQEASATPSQVARQLAFAGIGIVWLFSVVALSSPTLWLGIRHTQPRSSLRTSP
jgi:hypothetical protein